MEVQEFVRRGEVLHGEVLTECENVGLQMLDILLGLLQDGLQLGKRSLVLFQLGLESLLKAQLALELGLCASELSPG